jgi:hypothetical protein
MKSDRHREIASKHQALSKQPTLQAMKVIMPKHAPSLLLLLLTAAQTSAQTVPKPNVELASPGIQLEANQFKFDASFEVIDYNHDGLPDIL